MAQTLGFEEAQAPAFELMRLADEGLPFSALARAAETLGMAEPVLGMRLMGKATYYRLKKRKGARLSSQQSATILRQLRVRAFANKVFKDQGRAGRFMTKPHPLLDGMTALEASFSEFGAQAVMDVLGRGYYGVAY
jgi:putative toxin-antitoxin system antitoxin component (TIGR02293 family)